MHEAFHLIREVKGLSMQGRQCGLRVPGDQKPGKDGRWLLGLRAALFGLGPAHCNPKLVRPFLGLPWGQEREKIQQDLPRSSLSKEK